MTDPVLPNPESPIVDPGGRLRPEWYRFLLDVLALATDQDTQLVDITALQAAVAALEAADPAAGSILGLGSIQAVGDLPGQVILQLLGDVTSPAVSTYYGTSAAGSRGYHSLMVSALSDVDLTGLAAGDVLRWNGADWVRVPVSAYALTLIDDADAATARTTLGAQPAAASLTALSGALLPQAVDDAAAATAGVPVGGFYANASAVLQRQT